MNDIYLSGGFGLLFEEPIFPFGHTELLAAVRQHLGLKVQCPRDIKEGDMKRLETWHQMRLRNR